MFVSLCVTGMFLVIIINIIIIVIIIICLIILISPNPLNFPFVLFKFIFNFSNDTTLQHQMTLILVDTKISPKQILSSDKFHDEGIPVHPFPAWFSLLYIVRQGLTESLLVNCLHISSPLITPHFITSPGRRRIKRSSNS